MFKNNFVATVNVKNRTVRERNGIITLPFNSEYSIYLKNQNTVRSVAIITIDGEDIGHNIVIDPGSSVEIERYIKKMDNGYKFKFIKKIDDIKLHRGEKSEDGLVRIEFRKEKPHESYGVYTSFTDTSNYTRYNIKYDGTTNASSDINYLSGTPVFSAYSSSSIFPSDSIVRGSDGLTVPGGDSNQRFDFVHVGELESESTTIVFKLTGYDSRDDLVKQAIYTRKKYTCEYCGRKNKSYHTFCFNCGARIA